MTMTDGGNGSHDGDDGNGGGKPVGYKSPPLNGRIKKGEVRNPYGRNGRSGREGQGDDPFAKVASRPARVIIDGQVSLVSSEESFWLKQMHLAQQGNDAAARNIARESGARRRLGPPPPTAEELAQQEAEQAERERMSLQLVELLELKASRKRRSGTL